MRECSGRDTASLVHLVQIAARIVLKVETSGLVLLLWSTHLEASAIINATNKALGR